jgi:hypothetical protein
LGEEALENGPIGDKGGDHLFDGDVFVEEGVEGVVDKAEAPEGCAGRDREAKQLFCMDYAVKRGHSEKTGAGQ